MAFILPVGIDFADGVTLLPVQPSGAIGTPSVVGTKLPTADINIFSNNAGQITHEEPPGSPEIERAEQCTCSHTLVMSWNDAMQYWAQLPRGTIVTDSGANVWRVLSCKIKNMSATRGELSYVMESISFDSPPDDFQLNDVSLDFNIIKHPRYAWALNPYVTDSSTFTKVGDTKIYYTDIKESIIRMIQNYIDSPSYPSAAQVQGLIQSNILSSLNPNGATGNILVNVTNPNYVQPSGNTSPSKPQSWDGTNAQLATIPTSTQVLIVSVPYNPVNTGDPIVIAVAAAKELISKLWRQEDTPYIAGYEVVWTQYFFQPVFLNPGGYVEDPRDWVPSYFMNPYASGVIPRANQIRVGPVGGIGRVGNSDIVAAGGVAGESIFDYLTSINPQCYSVDGTYGGQLSMSCLRKSDKYDYERTWFKIPHSWLCAPIGKWDADLYNQNKRPSVSTDYNQLPNEFGQ